MPALAEAPVDPFSDLVPQDLIGGDNGAPAFQTTGGRFDQVPRAEVATPTELGAFADLVPADAPSARSMDYGPFHDLVPVSPTAEVEAALAETPTAEQASDEAAFKTDPLIAAEKGVERMMPGMPIHAAMNAVRSFGSAAGKYIFNGLQGLELNRAKLLAHPTPEMVQPQGDEVLLPDGSAMSKEQADALEQQYVKDAQAGVPDALAKAEYWKQRAAGADAQSFVDPELQKTVPARLAHTAGQAAMMGMESLIPGAGLPLMVAHGALATEAEARNAGKTPEEAEAAGVRSAIGLALFGGMSKLAALGVARLLPQGAEKLTKFVAQFVGQEAANETSSRALAGWEAAANAPEGQKVQAAMEAVQETSLEASTLNTVYALMHASKSAGEPARPATASKSAPAPKGGTTTVPPRQPNPTQPVTAQGSTAGVVLPDGLPTSRSVTQRFVEPEGAPVPDSATTTASLTRRAVQWHDELVSEGRALGEQIKILRDSGRQVPSILENRVNEINAELAGGFQPETPSHYQLRGEPELVFDEPTATEAPRETVATETATGAAVPENLTRSPEIEHLLSTSPVEQHAQKLKLKANKEGGFVNPDILQGAADFGAKIYQKGVSFAKWAADMVRHLGEGIKRHLTAIWRSVTGADFLPGKSESGSILNPFKRSTSPTPKGSTPTGDTEFLKIEPGYKRAVKGLERKGAADVIGETKNKVGKLLAEATTKHVDTEQELHGRLSGELLRPLKGVSKTAAEKGFDEAATYLAAKENGRPLPALSPTASKLITAWENIAEKTGQIAAANNVQVFDPVTGAHRPMHVMGRKYVPRMMKGEVERAMRDPESSPKLWNDLVDALAKQRGISDVAAAKELRAEAGRFSSNDFMGNLEMARTGKLPEIFYEYDLRNLASRYIPSFSERMAQIIAYGQRLGPRENPSRPNLWDVARKEAANGYTQTWLNNAEDQATNVRAKGSAGTGMARMQTAASGLLLSSPTTTVMRNLLSGVSATPELLGVRRSLGTIAEAAKSSQARMDAKEIGAVRDNIGDFLHADRLGDSPIDNAIRSVVDAGLKYSGYNGSEVFVRTHGMLTASQFAKDAVAALNKKPTSMQSKEALGLFKRLGVNAEKIVTENADWKTGPETRKFIRTVIRETQGGYRFDQVPLWANSNTGRFLYQFGRWGTQRARNIWKNGIQPALGEEVQWKGKTMSRRDVRPLLTMLGTTVVLGETFAGIAQLLFGRDRKDASLSEISAAWDDDKKQAVGLAMERMINDVIMAGTLGIWSQPLDWAKSLSGQSRLKNPTEPPGLTSVKAFGDLAQAAIDQGGDVTRRDLMKFAGDVTPGLKQLSDVARNVMDEPLYEAENDVRTLRAAALRWGKQSGLDVSPRSKGDFRKSEKAPDYEPIKEALLVGDAQRASFLTKAFLDKQSDRSKAAESLRASVKMSQPFRAGPYTAESHRSNFRIWARHNLNADDFQQTERIQERYVKAAAKAGLWK